MIYNELIIKHCCAKYGFRYELMNNYIKIVSKRDTWYIENREHYNRIKLMHHNRRKSEGRHYQGYFRTIYDIFKYIDNHDRREFMSNDHLFNIKEILVKL